MKRFLCGLLVGVSLMALYHWANPTVANDGPAAILCRADGPVHWVPPNGEFSCAPNAKFVTVNGLEYDVHR